MLAFCPIAIADQLSLQDVQQQIKSGSVLPLRQGVAHLYAENLIAAQDPSVCDYCVYEPDSLQLSINAVLRAIWIEQFYGGLTYCDRDNCPIAWSQSTIAINGFASATLTPSSIDFGEVPVATPEPEEWILLLTAVAAFALLRAGLRFSRIIAI